MHDTAQATCELPGEAGTRLHERVLICLDDKEREMFASGGYFQNPPVEVIHYTTGQCTPAQWRTVLREVQPTVLVTCWRALPLPEDYVNDPGLRLRYVCHLVGSVKSLVPRRLLERGVAVTNWGGIASVAVAEHALLLVLAALRRSSRWREGLHVPFREQPQYRIDLNTLSLSGRAVGIHGFGMIARHLVKLLQPFGVQVSACSHGVPESFMRKHGVKPCTSLEELFSAHSVVVECEALTPLTENSVTARILNLLPEDAVFVNVARGRLVDEPELARLARSGRIRVALDVYCNEPLPLPLSAELLDVKDAVLSPHIGGPTSDLYPRCTALAEANLTRFFNNEPLEAKITLQDYDRAT